MSLHEMTDGQISYYSENIANMLRNNGIFMEFNSYSGHSNPRTFPVLNKYFNHYRRFEFTSLAMVPTLWTNSLAAIENAGKVFKNYRTKIPLGELFNFDAFMEYPHTTDLEVQKLLDKDLGDFINCSITDWMASHKLQHANHLSYNRHLMEQKSLPSAANLGDERFWHQIKS
jgi:hypothetical protein